ncbi:hypothetical protein N7509_004518 [Penicillium cosmopolitanum]|uniref:Uncharacterized protein n=1 Tax=Penicillium cosmopolitanum TaxID=1131564 RepID=A0A9X0B957_9EURO|nr:uncharacterized protein N7509_004518 [Penicillium cosmopolitanum]KAJ5396405.1 hypothetical protein N7509_004518 [Penicillium cosmopolitanum]
MRSPGTLKHRNTRSRKDNGTKLSSIGVVDVYLGGPGTSTGAESAHGSKGSSECIGTDPADAFPVMKAFAQLFNISWTNTVKLIKALETMTG